MDLKYKYFQIIKEPCLNNERKGMSQSVPEGNFGCPKRQVI